MTPSVRDWGTILDPYQTPPIEVLVTPPLRVDFLPLVILHRATGSSLSYPDLLSPVGVEPSILWTQDAD